MDFYYKSASPPCCSVLMTAKAVGVELNKILLDLQSGDHLKPEFLKLNPQHTVPTLNDNGFVVWESRAIMIYLAEQYDKTDSLYPKCPQKQALINQRMFFDIGTLSQSFADYYYPQLFAHQPAIPDNFDKMEAAFDLLNTFLDGQLYSAGDSLTLADIALVATVSMYDAASFEINKYTNVSRWYKLVASVAPGFDNIQQGMAEFKQFFN